MPAPSFFVTSIEMRWEATMKILAFNSSPKMDKGNTALILNPFLEGARAAGGDVEVFCTKTLNINPCQGEFNCWLKTPGKCLDLRTCSMGALLLGFG